MALAIQKKKKNPQEYQEGEEKQKKEYEEGRALLAGETPCAKVIAQKRAWTGQDQCG